MSIGAFHYGTLGDILYSLPALREILSAWGQETVSYGLAVGHVLPEDTIDHTKIVPRTLYLSAEQARAMVPLLMAQPFIDGVDFEYFDDLRKAYAKKHDGVIDLNEFRGAVLYGWNGVPLPERYYLQYNVCGPPLSEPWLVVPDPTPMLGISRQHRAMIEDSPIVVNYTDRYPNPAVNRAIVGEFCAGKPTVFLGYTKEYDAFVNVTGCEAEHIWVNDYAQMAYIISKASVYLGNQSFAYVIADALSVPLVLEVCPLADHARPYGPRAYTVINQAQARRVYAQVALEVFGEAHDYYVDTMEEG